MNLADKMTLAYWVVYRGSWRMNIQAPNSFAARNGFVALLKELEPNKENLPEAAGQVGVNAGKDHRVATAQVCLKCKGGGTNLGMTGFRHTPCDNCGGMGAFITAQEIEKGYFIGDENGKDN